jgi:hypothetical protein
MLQNLGIKLSSKVIAWHIHRLGVSVLLGASMLGAILYTQPLPTHTQPPSQKAAEKKTIVRHTTPAKTTKQPAVSTPPAVATSPSTPAVTPVKTSVSAGAPKTEPVVTPSPSSNVSGLAPTTPAPSSSQTPSSQTTTGYTSTNWSGYLATNASFTGISGSWIATNATGNGSTISADSSWIGIGGVTSSDLIQVGTQNLISASGQVSTAAFYELLPNVSQPISGMTVSRGDSMTASIVQTSSGQWTINITDNTDKESFTIAVAYASSLSSAEWIEEDPSFSFRQQIPFDNFHEAIFTAGSTIANGSTVNIAASTAQPVTMVNSSGQATVAVPSAIGGDGASFTVSP